MSARSDIDATGWIPFPSFLYVGWLMAGFSACAGSAQPVGRDFNTDMAQILIRHRAYDAAVPLLGKQIASDPHNGLLHRLLGVVLRDRGLYSQAERELMQAHDLAPGMADTASDLGILYDLQGEATKAERWHRHAVALQPSCADFFNNLGFCLYLQARYPEAIEAYQHALHRDPSQPRFYNNLGFAQARTGNYAAAFSSFQHAGTQATAYTNLGLSYALAGDIQRAQDAYRQALRLDPALRTARDNLLRINAPTSLSGLSTSQGAVHP